MFTSFYYVAFTAKKPNVNINYYSVNFGIESEVYATLLGTCCLSMGLDGVTRKCNGCFKVPKCFWGKQSKEYKSIDIQRTIFF